MELDSFSMFPMAQTIELTPGEIYRGSIKVANPDGARSDLVYKAAVVPYNVSGDDYEADLFTESQFSEILNWITIDEPTGKVAPGEVAEVHFRIKVPGDAPGGGQYAAITVQGRQEGAEDAEDGSMIKSLLEMASVIYADVDGETVHEGAVLSTEIPGFATVTPVKTTVKLENNGNTHETALMTITVKNAWTGDVVFPLEGDTNTYDEVVMPGTTRTVTTSVERLASLGAYEITQTVDYMDGTYVTTQVVMICPVWFIMLILATIASAIWTVSIIIQRRKYKEQVF